MTIIPPRLSANGEHGLPVNPSICRRIRIFVDGDMLRHVVAYDIEAGWVEVIEHDERGFLVHRDGEWSTRRVHGQLRAALVPEAGDAA